MAHFIWYIVDSLVGLLILAIIANAILSWLVAFDIVNLRNRFAYSVAHFLNAVTRPFLWPVQKIIPPLGGIDISPIIVLLALQGLRIYLLPMIFAPLAGVLG
ncbi:MAG: YggT family protein [Alphaproteobacteria bacterium]